MPTSTRPSTTSRSASRLGQVIDDREPATRVLQQFRVIFKVVKSHFQQVEREAGIGGASLWALSVVRERPGIGISDLGAALHVRQPTASNLVKNLSQQALIEVRRSDTDRRAVHLHVTAEGRKVLRRSPGPFAGVLPDALAQMEPRALLALERSLGALIDNLNADVSDAQTPLAEM